VNKVTELIPNWLRALSSRKRLVAFAFDLGLGIALTVLLTAPAVLLLDTHILGYPHDGFAYIWKMWWTRKALFALHVSPADMSYVNFPYAGFNPHLVASPLINLLALPFLGWLGPLRTYNLLVLAAFALSLPTAAGLCYEFCRHRWAATVGGVVYAFFTNRVAHAVGGHMAQMFVFLFPLSALFLHRVWTEPERRRNSVLAGLFLALSALVDLKHVALFVLPLMVLVLLYYGIIDRRRWNRARVMALTTTLLVAALVSGPFFLPLVVARFSGRLDHFYAEGVIRHSADVTSFFVPSAEHPLYSRLEPVRGYAETLASEGWHENVFYLGWVTIALALVAAWRRRRERQVQVWLVILVAGMILSLGPFLKVGGRVTSIPLPYCLLQRLPFYDWGRTPGRTIGFAAMALAVLSACGAAILLARIRPIFRSAAALGLMALVLVDTLFVWPWPMGDAPVPGFYEQLASESEDYAVLDLPLWEYRCERYQLYYATVHNHRIVGGSVTRRSPEAEAAMRDVEQLVTPGSSEAAADALAELGIRYVVLHKLCLDGAALDEQSAFLTECLGSAVYDDEWIRAYEVPGEPSIDSP
jgi:hypothetical protein